jgi:hypothetical protein
MNPILSNYIAKAYDRLLDFSTYHCHKQGLAGEEVDILNEVFIDLLKKEESFLLELLSKEKKDGYCELDYLVLKLIRTYTSSPTAPYRWKYSSRTPKDENIQDLSLLNKIDEGYSPDTCAHTLKARRIAVIRFIVDRLPIDPVEKEIAIEGLLCNEKAEDIARNFGDSVLSQKDRSFVYDTNNFVSEVISQIANVICSDPNFDLKLHRLSKKKKDLGSRRISKINETVSVFLNVHWYPAFNEKSALRRLLDEV